MNDFLIRAVHPLLSAKRHIFFVLLLIFSTSMSFASLTGTYTINPSGGATATNYQNLRSAISDLTSGTRFDGGTPNGAGVSGAVILELATGYTSSGETFPLTFGLISGVSTINTITVRPASGVSSPLTISASSITAIIDVNGGDYIIFDGRPGGTGTNKYLKIDNTSASGVAVRFINDACNNTVRYCDISGIHNFTNLGVVLFSTTTGTTGNDSNTIDNCNIHSGSTTAVYTLYALGTVNKENNNNSISNCNIYDFFNSAGSTAGISISSYNTAWTISDNHFYQTAARTPTSSNAHYGIQIASSTGNNFTITGNYIGGSAPLCAGTAWTFITGFANRFQGISISTAASGSNSIQGNTIKNFVWGTTSTAGTLPGVWCGIYHSGGNVSIGNITGNTIGSATGTASVNVTSSGSGAMVIGIGSSATLDSMSISNNIIGAITTAGTTTSISCGVVGIYSASLGLITINNNTIGSTSTANSINASNASTGSTGQTVCGILNTNNSTVFITNNTIANLNNNYSGTGQTTFLGTVKGIVNATAGLSGSSSASNSLCSVTGNTIRNLSNAAPYAGTLSGSAVLGIQLQTSTTSGATNVSQNIIHSLSSSASTGAVNITGIYYASSSANHPFINLIGRNFIHSFSAITSGAGVMRGLNVDIGSSVNVQNNMIRLGIDATGSSVTGGYDIMGIQTTVGQYYNNTIYIGGTGVTGSQASFAFSNLGTGNPRKYINNIFVNARSNGSGTGKHYAIQTYLNSVSGLVMNNNIYYVSGNGGIMGFLQGVNQLTLADIQTATGGQDLASGSGNPNLVNPTGNAAAVDLHVASPTGAEGTGLSISDVTDDFDGNTRSGFTPTDIGAHAGNFSFSDIFPPCITSVFFSGNTSTLTNRTLNGVIITDVGTGIPATGSNRPRIWFRRSAPSVSSWASTQGTLSAGTGNNGTWSFTVDYSALGLTPVAGETYQYYIVVQDQGGTPNLIYSHPGGASHSDVNTQISASASPGSYTIVTGLPTTINVGTGQTYTSLSGFTGLFAAINAGALSGNTTVNVTSNLNEDGFTALNSTGMNGYTLTIKPSAAATRVIANSVNIANAMLRFNGATDVTMDGRFSGSGQYFRIINTHTTTASCNSAIQIMNGCNNITIRNAIIETNASNSLYANVYIGPAASTNIVISNNNIRDAVGVPGTPGLPATLIFSNSYSVVTVQDNNLFNSVNNLYLSYAGNGCNISGNSIYYNSAITNSTYATGIYIGSGNGHTVTGNYIGGQSANCGGSAWLNTTNVTFTAIEMHGETIIPSSIQGNTIQNISLTATTNVNFKGIFVASGDVNIGTTIGNIIGQPSVTNSIRNNGSSGGVAYTIGIHNTGSGIVNVVNNTISNFIAAGTSSNVELRGISHEGTGNSFTATGNTIYNLNSTGTTSGITAPTPVGIHTNTTSSNNILLTGNHIYNLSNTGISNSSHCAGISINGTGSGGSCSSNRIYGLTATSSASPYLAGISLNSGNGWTISNNQINITNSSNTNNVLIAGIYMFAPTGAFRFYYNTIYIGGNAGSTSNYSYCFLRTSASSPILRNNILYNERSGGTGFHYAISNIAAPVATNWPSTASNNNLFVVTNLNQVLEWGAVPSKTLLQWQSSSGGDANSSVQLSSNVPSSSFFTGSASSPSDLSIQTSSKFYVKDFGTPVPAVTTDFNNSTRPGNFTTLGAFEYGNGTAPLAAVGSPMDLTCNGICTGVALVTATGGTPPYTYSWSPVAGSSPALSSLCAATYTCTITDGASNQVIKTVIVNQPAGLTNNTISAAQTICSGSTPATLNGATPAGAGGAYTYSWISSTTSATSGYTSASSFGLNYSPPALTQNRWYRRIVIPASCPADTSSAVAITVNTAITGNTISGNQTMCAGLTPSAIIGSTPSGGNGTTYTYSWIASTSNLYVGFTAAAAPNNLQHYPPPALTQTTMYRRVVISGACASDTSYYAIVTVNPTPAISFGTTRCVNSALVANIAPAGDSLVRWYKEGSLVQTTNTRYDTMGTSPYGLGISTPNFSDPTDVKLDAAGNVYICDRGGNRILKYTPGSIAGTYAAGGGSTSLTTLNYPRSFCFDVAGNMFIADQYNHRVIKFPPGSTSATSGTVVAGGNGQGNAANQFYYPTSVAVDASGNLYVCDQGNSRIQKFPSGSTSLTNGTTFAGTGTAGIFEYHLSSPTDIVLDASGNLLVLDAGNSRVMKFPSNSTSGTYGLFVAGGNGGGPFVQISGGEGLAIDAAGYIYVTVNSGSKLLKFPPNYSGNGKATTVIGASGPGYAAYQLASPYRTFIHSSGLYVADNNSGKVKKFALVGNTYVPSAPGNYSVTSILSTGCYDTSVWVTVDPQITGNTATANQNICTGSAPSTLNGSSPGGGNGIYNYTWVSSSTSAATGYTPATGTNNTANYSPSSLTANTWYKRSIISGGCYDSTNAVAITVDQLVSGNIISSSQTICSGSLASSLSGSLPSGGNGSFTYSWLSSTTSATTGFAAASGTNTGQSYFFSAGLTQSTWFRRRVSSGACAADTSAAILITVQQPISNNTLTGTQTICNGTSASLITGSSPAGGSGTYSYAWISSTTSATTGFATATGLNTGINYSPGAITQNTWYRRRVGAGPCPIDTSAAVLVTVTPAITTNTASGTQTICSGSAPTALSGSSPAGGTGLYTFSWISSTTGSTSGFSVAAGTETNQNYSPSTLTSSTWFRRAVISGGCRDTTTAVAITVNPVIAGNTVSSNQSICTGTTPSSLLGTIPTGGNSSYTYSWLSSTTSSTAGFSVASGTTTGQNYTFPSALTLTTYYRRLALSGGCRDTSAPLTMTVSPVITSNTISANQLICTGTTPAALNGSVPGGGNGAFTYSWLSSSSSATTGFSATSGTAQGYSPSSLSGTTWFRRYATSGGCRDTSTAIQITVNAPGTWTGVTSTAWNNTSNWSCPGLPTSNTNVSISSGAPFMPVITDAQQCNNLQLNAGATLLLNNAASNLSIYGSITNSGTWTNNNGKITMSGSTAQSLPANTFNKLEINNPAGVNLSGTITVQDSLILTNGKLSLGGTSHILLDNASYVSGGSSTRYIATNGTGNVTSNNIGTGGKTGNITIPVGNSTYNPITINNTGAADYFTTRVIDSVTLNYSGNIPSGSAITSNAVARTWILYNGSSSGNNVSLTLQWNASDELTGFTRGSGYMGYYNGSTWMKYPTIGASGSNPYTITHTGITNFSNMKFGVGSGGTLPVELISFSALRQTNDVVLDWQTASEKNNDHFALYRSANGKDYYQVTTVKGNGTSMFTSKYSHIDESAEEFAKQNNTHTLYYKLTQTDFDGTVSEPSFATVKMNGSGLNTFVQPNPFTGDLNILLSSPAACTALIKITDMSGRLIGETTEQLKAGQQWIMFSHLEALADGLYFVNIQAGGESINHKVIKGR